MASLVSYNVDACKMTAVGFEPTHLAIVELESTPLDHSGKLSLADITATLTPEEKRSHQSTAMQVVSKPPLGIEPRTFSLQD